MLLRNQDRREYLIAAALPVHVALSVFWGILLARFLPRRRPVITGAVAGLAIGAFDLLLVGRHFPRIEALPTLPQFADHIAFGITVAAILPRGDEALPGYGSTRDN